MITPVVLHAALFGDAIKQRFKASKMANVISKFGKAKLEARMVTQSGSR